MSLLTWLGGGRWALWVGCVTCAALLAFAGVQTLKLAETRTQVATAGKALADERADRSAERARFEQAARLQAEHFRAVEQGWKDAQQEHELLARKARDLATAGKAAADVAGGRLRDRAATLAAACGGPTRDPTAVAAGPAASSPGDLLVDMLGRLESTGRELAFYADNTRISAEQCAADYEALRRTGAEAPNRSMEP